MFADNFSAAVEELELERVDTLREVVGDSCAVIQAEYGTGRFEQVNFGIRDLLIQFPERSNVVHDPERTPMGADDEIVVLDEDVGDLRDRKVLGER